MRPNFNKLFNPDFVKKHNQALVAAGKPKQSYNDYIKSTLADARAKGKEAPIEMTRIVMSNYMGPYTDTKGKAYYLCEFNKALDQMDKSELVKEDARFGLKNNFQRDDKGNFIQQVDDKGQPMTTINEKGETVPMYKNASLQRVDKEKFDNLMKNGIHTPRLKQDGTPVVNKENRAIDYVVFKAALQRVERPVTAMDKDTKVISNVIDPETGKQRIDTYYAPVLDYIQTKDMTFGPDGKATDVKPIPQFDAAKHYENAKYASASAPTYAEAHPKEAQNEAQIDGAEMQAPTDDYIPEA